MKEKFVFLLKNLVFTQFHTMNFLIEKKIIFFSFFFFFLNLQNYFSHSFCQFHTQIFFSPYGKEILFQTQFIFLLEEKDYLFLHVISFIFLKKKEFPKHFIGHMKREIYVRTKFCFFPPGILLFLNFTPKHFLGFTK